MRKIKYYVLVFVVVVFAFINKDYCHAEEIILDTPAQVYLGTVQDYLLEAGDYKLYPVDLSEGEYLQVRLDVPDDMNIDYDLFLYDSTLTNVIKVSDYITVLDGYEALQEALGYVASSDQILYLCVRSSSGGSSTIPFVLDYSITTVNQDTLDPDENASEAKAVDIPLTGYSVSRILNSPIDNDWYSFTVPNDYSHYSTRFSLKASDNIELRIYRNLVNNYYAMYTYAAGKQGELSLNPGTYYVRVVYTGSINEFNYSNDPVYTLSLAPVAPVSSIQLTDLTGYKGAIAEYYEGPLYRIDDTDPNYIKIDGQARYVDSDGSVRLANNALIVASVKNHSLIGSNRESEAITSATGVADENGNFHIKVFMYHSLGHNYYNAPVSIHRYDLMEASVYSSAFPQISDNRYFYLLHSPTDLY